MMANSPEDSMAAGSIVKPTKEWTETEGRKIMRIAVREKFKAGPMKVKLRATGSLVLVEATRNLLWGAGLPFNHPDILKLESCKGLNYQGKILMEIREEIS